MVDVRVDTAALQSFVVRIRDAAGRTLGSGVLVAPGWALTCAHVVAGADDVVLETSGEGRPARVALRSAPPRFGGLWPFPDLAVLRFDAAGGVHPIAPLDIAGWPARAGREPVLPDDTVTGWGFARREEGRDPPGSPASFVVEGVEGDGFITLKAGEAKPGLSGAPLVSPRVGTVVGLMSATRGTGVELGGYVSPVSALGTPELFTAPGGADVSSMLDALLATNRSSVLSDRTPWLSVLAIVEPGALVEQPWARFRKTVRSDPADLLRADFGVVDYLFRNAELERVRQEWCETPDPFGVLVVRGVGGSGKTRFAIQLCRRMIERGWLAGWLSLADGAVPADTPVLAARVPRVLVVDYVEAVDPQRLAAIVTRLAVSATPLAPARLMLVTRTRVGGRADPLDAIGEVANARVKSLLDLGQESDQATQPLSTSQRDQLYRTSVAAFATAWQVPTVATAADLSHERYRWPLDVLFEALDRVLTDDTTTVNTSTPPVERVLAHEQRYWAATMPDLDPDLASWAAAAATIAGADSPDEAHALLSIHHALDGPAQAAVRTRLVDWWSQLQPGPRHLNPLRPDRLGEHLAGTVLAGLGDDAGSVLTDLLALPSDRQLVACLDLLARAGATSPTVRRLLDTTIPQQLPALATRAAQAADPAHTGAVDRSVADNVLRHVTPQMLARIPAPGETLPGRRRDAAVACTVLTKLARDTGQSESAIQLARAALRIDLALAEAHPDSVVHLHDTAIDYLTLADLDRDVGRRDEAALGFRQAQEIYRKVAESDPADPAYRHGVAITLQRLADLDLSAGRRDEAVQGYRRYLAAAQDVADSDPGNLAYRRDVAHAVRRLADLDRDAGRRDDAVRGYRQAQEVYRQVAESDPGDPSHRRDVAITVQRLADLDLSAGRRDEAVQGYRRYLAAAQDVADSDPGNLAYRRDVAYAVQRLADLDLDAGRSDDAARGFRRYLAAAQQLVGLDPGNLVYRRDVAIALQRLADLDHNAGRGDEAAQGYRQAHTIHQRVVEADPGNATYRRSLAVVLTRLGDLAAAREDLDQARRHYQDAFDIDRALVAEHPDNPTYAADLEVDRGRLRRIQPE
ncbi:tetratricopeptide repeat protein [Dactylosporangium sp. NPDC049525]|uniref:tetratricopeptide repeat protein n=1 Tax=Dactylosporangium sp. NPDC049525 TaxID=3154730 RepID=UPI00342DC90E